MPDRSSRALFVVLLFAVSLLLIPAVVPAEDDDTRRSKSVSGRSRPAETMQGAGTSPWKFSVGAGVSAAGDVFRVKTDFANDWTAPLTGESFSAQRFTVTLDEQVLFSLSLARRVTARGWLSARFAWSEMEATALANDTQFVNLVLYDKLTFVRFGLTWEEYLLDTPLRPYLLVGAEYIDVGASAAYLNQGGLAPRVGAGLSYGLSGQWRLNFELSDTITQLDSDGIVDENWPDTATHVEQGPQHLLSLEMGLTVIF